MFGNLLVRYKKISFILCCMNVERNFSLIFFLLFIYKRHKSNVVRLRFTWIIADEWKFMKFSRLSNHVFKVITIHTWSFASEFSFSYREKKNHSDCSLKLHFTLKVFSYIQLNYSHTFDLSKKISLSFCIIHWNNE